MIRVGMRRMFTRRVSNRMVRGARSYAYDSCCAYYSTVVYSCSYIRQDYYDLPSSYDCPPPPVC